MLWTSGALHRRPKSLDYMTPLLLFNVDANHVSLRPIRYTWWGHVLCTAPPYDDMSRAQATSMLIVSGHSPSRYTCWGPRFMQCEAMWNHGQKTNESQASDSPNHRKFAKISRHRQRYLHRKVEQSQYKGKAMCNKSVNNDNDDNKGNDDGKDKSNKKTKRRWQQSCLLGHSEDNWVTQVTCNENTTSNYNPCNEEKHQHRQCLEQLQTKLLHRQQLNNNNCVQYSRAKYDKIAKLTKL